MREFYVLLLVVVFGVQAQAQVCTINAANASQDFCTICSSGANPAIVNDTFHGELVISSDYVISASCLNGLSFYSNFTINFDLPTGSTTFDLVFEQDPYLVPGNFTTLGADKSGRGRIHIYGDVYNGKGGGPRNFTALQDYMNSPAAYRALPVSLLNWTANEERGTVDLHWTTTEEEDHEYFVVEHSTDGTHFEELIAVMQPQGSYEGLLNDYEYVHQLPAQGTNYYRLVQYDRGGNSTTFDVRSVQLKTSATSSVYPNPAGAGQTIGLKSREEVHEATLYRLDGTPVATYGGTDEILSQVTLPSSLTSGTYLLRAGRQNHRVVIR